MGTYGSAKFSPMMNNMNNMINLLSIYDMMYLATSVYLFAILCQDMIGTYYVVSLPVVLPLAHKTGGLNHQHPGIVFGKVPGHGPPLYKIQISYETCGTSNITVSEVNSAPAWLIAVNLLLGGVLFAIVASFGSC